jgi:glycerol-3-phosphate dehydrogenase
MRRDESLSRLNQTWDVLIIGGGATGLGIAVDAATRGYQTLLVEARDFAQGTSSRSTKLVHGGVRYLEQGNISLVREALHERGRLIRNAPHLVHELRFLVPTYRWWEAPFYGTGLTLYDLLAGSLGLTRSTYVTPGKALKLVPTVAPDGLKGGIVYSDAQFNDTRLAIALARTADQHGATLLNDAPVTRLIKADGRIIGAEIWDRLSDTTHQIRARVVVNATGVFTDVIRRMDDPSVSAIMEPSQGAHILLDRSFLPSETAILVPKTPDGRVVFIIPWQGRTLVGTTDVEIPEPSGEPTAMNDEIDFILDTAGRYLSRKPTRADVLSVFAGLRPLVRLTPSNGGSTADISRDHELIESPSGLVTMTGGKWTTYRQMAEDAVTRAAAVAALPPRPCLTANLPLFGADSTTPRWFEIGASDAEIADYEARFPGELHPSLPYSLAMAAYVIDLEMPVHLDDLLSRRLRALYLDARAARDAAPRAAELMARLQGHDAAWVASEVASFNELAAKHVVG